MVVLFMALVRCPESVAMRWAAIKFNNKIQCSRWVAYKFDNKRKE